MTGPSCFELQFPNWNNWAFNSMETMEKHGMVQSIKRLLSILVQLQGKVPGSELARLKPNLSQCKTPYKGFGGLPFNKRPIRADEHLLLASSEHDVHAAVLLQEPDLI